MIPMYCERQIKEWISANRNKKDTTACSRFYTYKAYKKKWDERDKWGKREEYREDQNVSVPDDYNEDKSMPFSEEIEKKRKVTIQVGLWLFSALKKLGLAGRQVEPICGAHYENSFKGNPYKIAMKYANICKYEKGMIVID